MNSFEGSFVPRESGVLMPFRAMPGDHDFQGTYGPGAKEFLIGSRRGGFSFIHDLPLSPPDIYNSPYSSVSAFAIDPRRIDLYELAEEKDISRLELDAYQRLVQSGDAGTDIRIEKDALLQRAFNGFIDHGAPERKARFARWKEQESEWLDSFATFEILKDLPGNTEKPWQEWEYGAECNDSLISDVKSGFDKEYLFLCYKQWVAHEQTMRYLDEADRQGLTIWGDVPFYVGDGEVWAHREIFDLDENGYMMSQGGAAPSISSATGQLWGMAPYKLDNLENPEQTAKVVGWWTKRLARMQLLHSGKTRLDHFIGMAEPYILAADAKDGMNGVRGVGVGYDLLSNLVKHNGTNLNFYPEDLGTQTEKTGELRDAFNLACNAIAVRGLLKCARNREYSDSIHNPSKYRVNSVNMSSNHDMLPLRAAFDLLRTEDPGALQHYLDSTNQEDPHLCALPAAPSELLARREMERIVKSVGNYAVLAAWDILKMGKEGHYNAPGTTGGSNWSWRMDQTSFRRFVSEMPQWYELNQAGERLRRVEGVAAAD